MASLQHQIQKRDPFESPTHEAIISIAYTADQLSCPIQTLLDRFELTGTQYNVLRILRGTGEAGLPCGQISQQMIHREPDMTRLLDRLEKRGLISRCRGDADRRVVRTRITEAGLGLIALIDEPLRQLHQQQLSHMSSEQISTLINLLAVARGGRSLSHLTPKEGSL